MIALDLARVLLAGIGAFIGAYQLYLIRTAVTNGQRARLAGVAVAMAVLSGSRLQNLGNAITWQFVGTVFVFALLAYGSWKWRDEIPSQPRPRRHRPSQQ